MAPLPLLVRGDPWLYTVARVLLGFAATVYGRLDLREVQHLPRTGPAVVVANHPSDLDPLLVALPVARTLHFLASADHYDRRFVGWCMNRLATVSVDRYGDVPEALREAAGLLSAGEVVALFPEPNERERGAGAGGGSSDHPLGSGGAEHLASSCGAPLVRVTIEGSDELQWGRWRRELPAGWLRRPRVRVTFAGSSSAGPGPASSRRLPGSEGHA